MGFVIESVILEFLGVVLAALFTVFIYLKYGVYNYWKSRGVPQDQPTVPFGNLLPTLAGKFSIGECFADAYSRFKKYPFFGTYAFHKPSLVINDPDLIRHVLVKDFKHFHDRGLYCNEKIDPLSGQLPMLPGTKWRNLRVKLSPTFTSGKMKFMFDVVKESGELLSNVLEDMAEAKEIIEIKDIIARYSTDVISSVAFGIQCNSLKEPDAEFRYWGRKVLQGNPLMDALAAFAPIILDLFSIPTTNKDVSKFFIRAFNDTVAYRKANNVTRNDFLQLVMQLMEKGYVDVDEGKQKNLEADGGTSKLSALEGAAQAFVFYVAGFETSSSTVTHCIYELAMNPDIQEKLRREIDEELEKNGGLTYESLNNMTYLSKVVDETLRKYPSIPILNRICTEDLKLPNSDLTIKKGTPIIIPVLGIQRDPDHYPEPDKFDPERFNEENKASRNHYTYLPFGEGPRVCIGMRFGLIQTKTALISVLSKYRFKPTPETKSPFLTQKSSFVLVPSGGMPLRIEKR